MVIFHSYVNAYQSVIHVANQLANQSTTHVLTQVIGEICSINVPWFAPNISKSIVTYSNNIYINVGKTK